MDTNSHRTLALPSILPRSSPAGTQDFATFMAARRRREAARRILRGFIGFAVVIALWEYGSRAMNLEIVLPRPITIVQTLINTLTLNTPRWLYGPNIYQHLLESLRRAMTGFLIAAAFAIPLGLVVGRIRAVREFVLPTIKAVYPIPSTAWIPLALLWFGLSDAAIIFVVCMSEFFPLFFNTEAGARQANPTIVNAGRCFGAKGWSLFFRVILPSAFPSIVTGLRIGIGLAWRSIVAAEMFAAAGGVGYMLMEARFQFRAADLIMAMILISVCGYVTERLIVGTIERKTIEKWEVAQ